VTHTRRFIDTTDFPDDEREVARNMYRIEINIQEKICASSWSITRIIPRWQNGQQNTKNTAGVTRMIYFA
jgi:hypothetical protein